MKSNNFKLVFAKKKDFDFFFKGEEVVYSAKAWVLKNRSHRIAIGGVWLMPMQFTSFVRTKGNLPKKTFWKASKDITAKLREMNLPIICEKENIESARNYLEKLGYKYYKTHNNKEIYKLWRN